VSCAPPHRVGLFEITGMGQLTSTQIKNAYRILNVLSGIAFSLLSFVSFFCACFLFIY
jgi:hypothetical protein